MGGRPPILMKMTGDRGRRTAHSRLRSPVFRLPSIFISGYGIGAVIGCMIGMPWMLRSRFRTSIDHRPVS